MFTNYTIDIQRLDGDDQTRNDDGSSQNVEDEEEEGEGLSLHPDDVAWMLHPGQWPGSLISMMKGEEDDPEGKKAASQQPPQQGKEKEEKAAGGSAGEGEWWKRVASIVMKHFRSVLGPFHLHRSVNFTMI